MKNLSMYFALLLVATMAACTNKTDESKGDISTNNAALNLYNQYAINDDLTVAYLGDFNLKGKKIDAVMLQANDEEGWLRVRQDFGLVAESDSCEKAIDLSVCPESEKVVSVGIGIETDFLTVMGLDSLTTRDQITEEHIKLFSENIAMQLRDILSNFDSSDSLMPAAAIIVGDGPISNDGENLSYDNYISVVADAIADNIIEEYFTQRDSIVNSNADEAYQKAMAEGDEMMTNAKLHGHSGYITATDHSNQTLWLFFYDDQEECNNILSHIREDIIIKQ